MLAAILFALRYCVEWSKVSCTIHGICHWATVVALFSKVTLVFTITKVNTCLNAVSIIKRSFAYTAPMPLHPQLQSCKKKGHIIDQLKVRPGFVWPNCISRLSIPRGRAGWKRRCRSKSKKAKNATIWANVTFKSIGKSNWPLVWFG